MQRSCQTTDRGRRLLRPLALLTLALLALALAACQSSPQTATRDFDEEATATVEVTATVEATATAEASSVRSSDYQGIFGQSSILIPPTLSHAYSNNRPGDDTRP